MKKEMSLRTKDILAMVGVTVFSLILMLALKFSLDIALEKPLIYVWYAAFLYPLIFGFWESLDGDLLIEGRTQKMGVVNSFTVTAILIGIAPGGFWGWLCTDLAACGLLFAARESGRYKRQRMKEKYVGREAVLLGDLPNMAKAQMGDKTIKVCAKEQIAKGTVVIINELKGTYKYVTKKRGE